MKVERTAFEDYKARLIEYSRPPSKGGNTKALHVHVLIVAGVGYSFFAAGTRRWAFKGDTVAFEWKWDDSKRYRNIIDGTLEVWDKKGPRVSRGESYTKRQRTAPARLPGSRREQRD